MINLNKKIDLENTPKIKKVLLNIAGYIFVILGIIGIFLPIMPTTIFFILAAASFLRSSPKNYERLINNRYIGKYIKNYIEQQGMTLRSKVISISLLWLTLIVSIIFFAKFLWLKILLALIGLGVSIKISRLKTLNAKTQSVQNKITPRPQVSEND
jgi:uncharacterized membrane protein YbaN (DUF454 family)